MSITSPSITDKVLLELENGNPLTVKNFEGLGISSKNFYKAISRLRSEGYDIELTNNKYQLIKLFSEELV